MKSNAQPPLYFSMYPLKAKKATASSKPVQQQSPYLKAILSRRGGAPPPSSARLMNSDRMAAIRYIQDSRFRDNK
jgi:hypothetical protein